MSFPIVFFNKVTIGSLQHLVPIAFAIIFTIVIIKYANHSENLQLKNRIFSVLGWFVSLTLISYHIYKIAFEDYNFNTDLPLFLCSFLALIIPIFTTSRKFWMFEILVFWIIAGTTQGILTPDIKDGFPTFDYFRYWTVHLGLVSIIVYAIVVLKMRPKFKSVLKSILALQVYALIILFLNWFLNANYSYLSNKPEVASAFDFLHDWPWYILEMELIIIPYFLIIYLVFYLVRKK